MRPRPATTLAERFADAQVRVKTLPAAPDPGPLLDLYARFKQGTASDVTGAPPGMLDIRNRARYDAWAKQKGGSRDTAMECCIALVDRLLAK